MSGTGRPLHGHALLEELLRQAEAAGKRPAVRDRISGPEALLLPNVCGRPVAVPPSPRRRHHLRAHQLELAARRVIAVAIVGCALLLGANALAMTLGILAAAIVLARVPVRPRTSTVALTKASSVERPALALVERDGRFAQRRHDDRRPVGPSAR